MIFLSIFLIILTVYLTYKRTFRYHLICDDLEWRKKKKTEGFGNYKLLKGMKMRLYSGGTFARKIEDKKWDWSIYWDHVFQTILHGCICVGIYFTFGINEISLAAALLYAVNPANNQTAVWINGRRYAVNILIMLAIMSLGVWGLILYPLTVMFQVNAFFTPLLVGPWGAMALPLFLLLGWKEIKEKIITRHKLMSEHCDHRKFIFPGRLIVILKLYGLYWMKMIFPGRTMFAYPHFHYWGLTEEGRKQAHSLNKDFYLGVVAAILTVVGLFYFKGQMFWWFLVMCLATLQWCAIIPVTQVFTDRYISLANVFMMFFLAHLSFTFGGDYAITIITALLIYYLTELKITLIMYKDIFAYHDHHIYFDPTGPSSREQKATRLMFKHNDPMGAWEAIKRGLEVNPNDMKLNLMAAQIMDALGDKSGVIMYLKNAKKNIYIGQDHIYKAVQNNLFGLDLEKEIQKIENKESKLDRKIREQITKVYNVLKV